MTTSGWALLYGLAFVGGVAVGGALVEIYWVLRSEREANARAIISSMKGRLYHD